MPGQRARRAALIPVVALLLSPFALPVATTPVAATGGSTLTSIVNRYRADVGAPAVTLHTAVDQIAVERGDQLAAARRLGHDLTYVADRLTQYGVCWSSIGEIVAWNTTGGYESFVQQWYKSSGHRAIMLGSNFTHAGGSSSRGGDGRYYAVMIFIRSCGGSSAPGAPTGTFVDTGSSAFAADIEWLADEGITNGCGGSRFCPAEPVTRAEMASFVARADSLAAAGRDYFFDDEASLHEADINRIAQAAITNGCGGGMYCPAPSVTRAEMAAFLARALGLPSTPNDYFRDDEDSPLEDAINRLAAAGVTNGCGGGRYCPSVAVTREEMAAFLRRAFD